MTYFQINKPRESVVPKKQKGNWDQPLEHDMKKMQFFSKPHSARLFIGFIIKAPIFISSVSLEVVACPRTLLQSNCLVATRTRAVDFYYVMQLGGQNEIKAEPEYAFILNFKFWFWALLLSLREGRPLIRLLKTSAPPLVLSQNIYIYNQLFLLFPLV